MTAPDSSPLPGIGDAAEYAAEALLGELLWRPERIRDLQITASRSGAADGEAPSRPSEWLTADDFGRPAHGVIFEAIRDHYYSTVSSGSDLAGAPPKVTITAIARGLMDHPHPNMGATPGSDRDPVHPLSAPRLHRLLTLAPVGPDGASEHVRYAQLVLEASIRRQVSAAGTRIGQYAEVIATRSSDDAAAVLRRVTDHAVVRLDDLQHHLAVAAGRTSAITAVLAPTGLPRAASPEGRAPVTGTAEGTTPVPLPEPKGPELDRAEPALLSVCAVDAKVRAAALETLRPEDFLRTDAATTFTALTRLVARGEPVDLVLLAAETEHVGATAGHEPGLNAQQLHHNANRYRTHGHRALEIVARASLCRHATAVGHALRAAALDRGQRGPELVRAAHAQIADLAGLADRIGGATAVPVTAATVAVTALRASGSPPDRAEARTSAQPAARNSSAAAPPHQRRPPLSSVPVTSGPSVPAPHRSRR